MKFDAAPRDDLAPLTPQILQQYPRGARSARRVTDSEHVTHALDPKHLGGTVKMRL